MGDNQFLLIAGLAVLVTFPMMAIIGIMEHIKKTRKPD